MKDKILQKAADMFLSLGFKSVTMDDIASELGMSKKTIYSHFSTKRKLVEASTFYVLDRVNETICSILDANYDPIEETFTIKSMVNNLLKNERSSPSYQLQKYYPKTYEKIMKKEFLMFRDCILRNIEKGINRLATI